MLKIKDNVDLKELEKFGFEKINDIYRYSSKEANKDDLNILYDLIKADLVEKVEG